MRPTPPLLYVSLSLSLSSSPRLVFLGLHTNDTTASITTTTTRTLVLTLYAQYTNNRFGTEWFIYLGSSLCGLSAGIFWMAEAAIAIAYPEPWNKGKALGYWLTYRLAGQILGGAINLGLNVDRDQAGKVTYTVYLVFIALQCIGPVVGCFLNTPDKVERKDGKKVVLRIAHDPVFELKETARLFCTKKFLLILLWIGQAVFSEAVYFTYLACKSFLYLFLFVFPLPSPYISIPERYHEINETKQEK